MTVDDLLSAVLPRLGAEPQMGTFLDTVQTVQEVITRRLWAMRSELIEGDFEIPLEAEESEGYLPSSVLGLKKGKYAHPWIIYDSTRHDLKPLPDGLKDRASLSTSRKPDFYRLRGRKITVYPATDIAATLKGEGFIKPRAIISQSDELPWFGMFDQVFIDTVSRFGAAGMALSASEGMALFLNQQVDQIASQRPNQRIEWRYPA